MTSASILVTGGSGFIGTNVVAGLVERGVERVVNLDAIPPRHPQHRSLWREGDIRDRATVLRAVDEAAPDVVIHLAARTDLDGATLDDYTANTRGVEHVIAAVSASTTVQRVLFASSQLVCRPGYVPDSDSDYRPINPYGESKVIGEQLVRERAGDDVTWMLLRPTTIWGPWWGELYSAFFRTVRAGRYLHPKGVRIAKAFGYVGNTVHQLDALTRAPADQVHGRTLYLSDYEPYPIREWADEIAAAFGVRRVREVPTGALRALATAGDVAAKLGVRNPPISSYRLANMLTPTGYDMAPLEALCGDLPYTRVEGVAATVEWMSGRR